MITKARGTFDDQSKIRREKMRKIDIKNKEIKKKKKMIDRYFYLKESLRMQTTKLDSFNQLPRDDRFDNHPL